MSFEIAVAVFGVCMGLGGFIFGLVSTVRNKKTDDANEGKQMGTVLTEIGYIKSGVDRVERKQDAQDEKYTNMAIKIADADSSAKQAHKRIDGLADRIGRLEEHEHFKGGK